MKKPTLLLLSLIIFGILAVYMLSMNSFMPKVNQRVFLIVIDAADWKVITPLIEQGEIPNIKRMIDDGSSGILTTYSSFSPVDWTGIATGKTPKKHGITYWNVNGYLAKSTDIRSKRVWNILNDYGITTGVYQYLITWPPEKVNGFMISDPLLYQDSNVKYPLNLDVGDYAYTQPSEFFDALADTYSLHNSSLMALHLLGKYNPSFFVFGDRQLLYETLGNWKYLKPEEFNITDKAKIESRRKRVIDLWKEVDYFVGELEKYNETILLVSDHGLDSFNPPVVNIFFNTLWSELYTNDSCGPYVQPPYRSWGEDLRLDTGINTEYIYFNNRTSSEEKEKIISDFSKIRYAETNESFFLNLTLLGENKLEVKLNLSLRLLKESIEGYYYIPLILPDGKVFNFDQLYEFSASHFPNSHGIIIASGQGIKRNYKISDAINYDITPTILYLYNIPIPEDMDGKVLTEMINPDYLKEHPVKYSKESSQWSEEQQNYRKASSISNESSAETIKEKLRRLGYSV